MKKTKLIATIASVCLAIALVVFGVYASNIGSVGMSSTISYQASGNLDITILVTVEYSTETVSYNSENANTTYVDNTLTPSVGYTTINAWSVSQGLSDDPINLTGDNVLNLGAYNFIAGSPNGSTLKYTITITNNGYYPIKLTKSNEPTTIDSGVVTLAVSSTGLSGDNNNQIAKADTSTGAKSSYVFTATYTLSDNVKDLETPYTFAPAYSLSAGVE